MTQRLLSASNYMLDAFLLSLLLVFIDAGTIIPLPFVWLSLNAIAAIVSFLVFLQIPYRPDVSALIGLGSMLLAFLAGASIIAVLLFSLAAVYRLHERFSASDEEGDSDNRFLFKFVLLFAAFMIISLINPAGGKSGILYAIALSAVSFYVAVRLLHRFLKARSEGASRRQLLLSFLTVLGLSAIGGILVYLIADETRYMLGTLLGKLVSIASWPLVMLMDRLVEFLNGLTPEEQKQQTIENMEMGDAEKLPTSTGNPIAADFPFELVFAGILLLLLFLLVRWLRKTKMEKAEERKTSSIHIERSSAAPVQVATAAEEVQYATVNLDIVRKAFRDFERDAVQVDKGREKHETVREWLKRMEWTASEQFFETYDLVRYGNGQIAEAKALPFLEEIKKIKDKYLKLNV